MSNHRAIAAVTATLKHLISHALARDTVVAGALVTARPPDRARHGHPGNQVNLFLYHTSIAASWRNEDPPGTTPGEAVHSPLPLELSYLISAYGENDDEVLSGRLLGLAVSVLHDRPLLSRREIGDSLQGSELEHQAERVRITPHPIPLDEVSRLWSTFGTGYRISVSYRASVVLIDSTRPVVAPLPVLTRGVGDTGPQAVEGLAPQIDLVALPRGQHAAGAGDLITLRGRSLDRVVQVRISGIRLAEPVLRAPVGATASTLTVSLPDSPALPAGTVALTPLYDDGSGRLLSGNDVFVGLAPSLVTTSPVKAKLAAGSATVQVRCKPRVLAGQTVALVVGDRIVAGTVGPPGSPPREKLAFALEQFEPGTYTLRLRVDGQDSIPIRPPTDPAEPALQLDPAQRVVLT
jgi:Pvc16 N-terminal domain